MTRILTGASVSLDGYIAGPNESGFEHLFAWYTAGEVEFPSTHPEIPFRLTQVDHDHLRTMVDQVGAMVVGRRLFDLTHGWNGVHPLDRPVVVVTHRVPDDWQAAHPGAPFTFVTDGLEPAIDRARELAGDRDVVVNAGSIASQCLELGLLDEVWLDLVPVLLGGGVPFFEPGHGGPVTLEDPEVVPGTRVTHLRYLVRRG